MEKILRQFSAFCVLLGITFIPTFVANQYIEQTNSLWYAQLSKPFFTPPQWVFGTVWTVFYILMACAAWMIWKRRGFLCTPLYFYYLQLCLNGLFMPLFFGYHSLWGSTVLSLILLWAIGRTIRLFARVDHFAALAMVPYIIWVCFACVLNATIAYMN